MYTQIIRNDVLRNKLISFTSMLFITVATTLVSIVAILTINLVGSIHTLTNQAQVPDFLQMHSGPIDQARMDRFADENEQVHAYQVLNFLNVANSKIQLGNTQLLDSIQDNGFSTQSPHFDFLLDLKGKPIQVAEGELYVPIGHMKDGSAKIGEKAVIAGKEFQIAGFLRDGQMNSPLASSKRFLVHENDYQKLVPEGTIEYLIEFQLKDSAAINTFETAYADAGLEANGPTLTNALFKLINGLSDGIMIAIILLVGLLIVLIALMCIRFTLLTKIEEDYQEIGTMKAIGLRIVDIKKIYLAKYALLSLIGCLTGLSFAFIFSQPLLENIRLYLGESSYANWSVPLATVSSLTVFFMVIGYIQFLLRKFRKLSAASAIRTGSPEEKITTSRYLSLSKNNLLSTNLFLGIKDVFARKKLYATMLIVLFLASFMMIIPWNTYQTIADSSFSKYLGFGEMDLMVSMYQSDAPIEREQQINHSLEQNSQIKQFVQVTSKSFKVKKTDGSEEKLVIEMGDHDAFPIEYNSGQAPQNENEIALSSLNAVEFDKTIGDSIEIITNQGTRQMTVSGIYSNIFNGGKTAKANFEDSTAPTLWLNYYIQLHQQQEIQGVMTQLTKEFPFAKVTDAQNHKQQVFGSMISSIQTAAIIAFLVALFITGLVSLLFMRLLVAKDRVEIAMLKSLGFTNQDISRQYVTRSTFVLIISVFSGSILANTLGETIVSMAVSSFGVDSFTFIRHPLVYAGLPLLMFVITFVATKLGSHQASNVSISENLKE